MDNFVNKALREQVESYSERLEEAESTIYDLQCTIEENKEKMSDLKILIIDLVGSLEDLLRKIERDE